MALFNLLHHTKETVWYEQRYNVEADTKEQAVQRLLEVINSEDERENQYVTRRDGDYLLETQYKLTPEENDGNDTEIIYMDNNDYTREELWSNNKGADHFLNRHGKKLLKAMNQYSSDVFDNHLSYRKSLALISERIMVHLIIAHPHTFEDFIRIANVNANFPAELANGFIHVIKTGTQP